MNPSHLDLPKIGIRPIVDGRRGPIWNFPRCGRI